jgi:hypothetical protein
VPRVGPRACTVGVVLIRADEYAQPRQAEQKERNLHYFLVANANRTLITPTKMEETCYGFSSASDSDLVVNRSRANLALQQRLGILAQRWYRVDTPDRPNSRALESNLDQ